MKQSETPIFVALKIDGDDVLCETAALESLPLDGFRRCVAVVKACEDKTGTRFDRPFYVSAAKSRYAFFTRLGRREDGGARSCLSIPSGALTGEPPLRDTVLEGAVLHELGHAAQKEQQQQLYDIFSWNEPLAAIMAAATLVRRHPERLDGALAKIGGAGNFLKVADFAVNQISGSLEGFRRQTGSFGVSVKPEMLVEKLAEPRFRETLKSAAAFRHGTEGRALMKLAELSSDVAEKCGKETMKARPEQAMLLARLQRAKKAFRHAQEYAADDFAVQHAAQPLDFLTELRDQGLGLEEGNHPSIANRIRRAETRIRRQGGKADEADEPRMTRFSTRTDDKSRSAVGR